MNAVEKNLIQKFKTAAKNKLDYAVRKGLIKRPKRCSNCPNTGRIEGHHEDYSKPFEVDWLCVSCHQLLHYWKLSLPFDRKILQATG